MEANMAKKTSQGLSKIKSLVLATENQIFDRKSFLIETKSLANIIVAFANADGGEYRNQPNRLL